MISLSEHFKDRWIERAKGPVPSEREVHEMLQNAIVLQKFRKTYTPRGRPQTILALFWIPLAGLVIKADMQQMQAVTVITDGLSDREPER